MKKPLVALICGGAKCVFDDIKAAGELFVPDAVFAVNDVVASIRLVDFFVTMHPMKAPDWLKKRHDNGFHEDPKSYWTAIGKPQPVSIKFKTTTNTNGGSGLLAVSVARYLSFEKIVLAGIPMTPDGAHYFNPKPWKECIIYRLVWEKCGYLGNVRSMSGWTREHLDAPTLEWLNLQER